MFGATLLAAALQLTIGMLPLVDQNGARFALNDLRGRPAVVSFIATRCTDTCPITDAVFSKLARDRGRERLVTITLDPKYDTPFVMARHARELNAPAEKWRVASGSPRDVAKILAAFGIVLEYDKDGVPDAHSSFIYVFDAAGHLKKTLPLSNHSAADVEAAVRS
jgi:cytochrome oxidase Cu insertion factor (SCO1/SenC/PrrC family)